ncbi:arginase family protein [Bacillaceae bacterium Marseille-Q3522]|nr:arginase family protein [Bacillaceae bacterium Marseille-Q3522]
MLTTHENVTVLNFDHAYESQTHLQKQPFEWLDFTELSGTSRFCSVSSMQRISQKLQQRKCKGITLLGSGNYHYVTYLLLNEFSKPFTLLLFDHHTDMKASNFTNLISCGSWVLHALKNHLLKKVCIIGVREDFMSDVDRVKLFKKKNLAKKSADEIVKLLFSEIPTDNIYISIDKDVFDETEACTNWDHGSMRVSVVSYIIKKIVAGKVFCGADICGEYPYTPDEFLPYRGRNIAKINERANMKLLETLIPIFNHTIHAKSG